MIGTMVKKIAAIVIASVNVSGASGLSICDDILAIISFKTICNGQILARSGMKIIALYQEFQLPTAKNKPTVANIGRDNGKKILAKMMMSFAPSIFALSSISAGKEAK